MLFQYLFIGLLFATALFFIGRRFWRAFFAKSQAGCAQGCGACGTLDVDRLQRTIEARAAGQPGR